MYSKFYILSPKVHLTKDELINLLNQNVLIRKLLPYSTKRLNQIELSDDNNIIKEIKLKLNRALKIIKGVK